MIPAVNPDCSSSRGGSCHAFAVCQPVPGKQSHDHAVVCNLWQHRAERWHQHFFFFFQLASILLYLGIVLFLGTTHSFWDPEDPETMVSHLGFPLLCYLSTFKAGTLPLQQTSKNSDFCALLLIILGSSLSSTIAGS